MQPPSRTARELRHAFLVRRLVEALRRALERTRSGANARAPSAHARRMPGAVVCGAGSEDEIVGIAEQCQPSSAARHRKALLDSLAELAALLERLR